MESSLEGFLDRLNPRMFESEPLQRCRLHECHGACCIFGVWVDKREVDDINRNAALIQPYMPLDCQDPQEWFAGVEDADPRSPSGLVIHTAVENRPEHYGATACEFWLPDGKCALQVASVQNHLHPWRFKPYYCILHPLDLDDKGRITLDSAEELLGEQGSCIIPAEEPIPLILTFEPELRYLLGDRQYVRLKHCVGLP